jgi:membrane protein DedA with SNARE-associated domain
MRLFLIHAFFFCVCLFETHAQQTTPTNETLEQQLTEHSPLNEQIEKISNMFKESLGSERTRITVMDFTTNRKEISLLGNYIRRTIVKTIGTNDDYEIVDQVLVLKEITEQKLPMGATLSSSRIYQLAEMFFADAVITGSAEFDGTICKISAQLYSEDALITSYNAKFTFDDMLKQSALQATNNYPEELLSIQKENSAPSFFEYYTEKFIEKLGKMKPIWIYFIISFIAFIENVFPPFPSDAVVVFGGFLVGVGKVKYWILLLGSTIGSTLGFMLAYYIGVKCSTTKISSLKIRYVPVDALLKVGAWFSKYGYTLIVVNRFLAGTRAVVSFFAGLSGLPLLMTTVLSFLSALAWNALLLYGGTSLGKNWHLALEYIGRYSHAMLYVLITIAVIGIVVYLWKLNKKTAKQENEEETT